MSPLYDPVSIPGMICYFEIVIISVFSENSKSDPLNRVESWDWATVNESPNPENITSGRVGFGGFPERQPEQSASQSYPLAYEVRNFRKSKARKDPQANMATEKERKLQIEPIVQESVVHNARVRSLSSLRRQQVSLISTPS